MATWDEFAPKVPTLPPGKKWHVFLSYRSVNRPWVINLYDVLRTHGYDVFLDQVVLKPSDKLVGVLEQGMRESRSAILIWSKQAAKSGWVDAERNLMSHLAMKDDFFFVPVKLDQADLPDWSDMHVSVSFANYPDGPNGGELLRLLHALNGEALPERAVRFATEQGEVAHQTAARIRAAIKNENIEWLRSEPVKDDLVWTTSAALGCAAAEGLTKLDECDDALAVLDVLEKRFRRAIRPKQLRALALARRGDPGDLANAQDILGTLYESGERDPETIGMYARTFKDRWAETKDVKYLRTARRLYKEGFEAAPDDSYVGINAAATSVFIGEPKDLELARELATAVQGLVGSEPVPGDYWQTATIGEVYLIRQDYDNAAKLYQDAVDIASTETGSHKTTWKQACRLMAKLGPTPEQREKVLKPFAGLGKDCSEVAD